MPGIGSAIGEAVGSIFGTGSGAGSGVGSAGANSAGSTATPPINNNGTVGSTWTDAGQTWTPDIDTSNTSQPAEKDYRPVIYIILAIAAVWLIWKLKIFK